MSALFSAGASVWLAASLLATEPVSSAQAAREIGEIFEQPRYYFCAEDHEYLAFDEDQRWCELAARPGDRGCPGFAQVCAQDLDGGEIEGDSMPWRIGESDGDGDKSQRKVGKANPNAHRDREQSEFRLPDLGGFAKVLMWALLIGIAIAVIVAVAKNFVRDNEEDEPEDEPEFDASESLIAARAVVSREVETDVQRLLKRAEAEAMAGDHEAAIHDMYAALLRRLEGEQLIAVDRWKTNGDYIQDLRPRPPLRDEVREIVREVEQVQFGSAPAEAGRYQSIRARVLAIVGRATLALALAFGLSAQTACDPDERPDSSALAGLGTGPSGQRAIGELLLVYQIEARHRSRTIEELSSTDGAIVLLDDVELADEDWELLLAWVEDDGGMLVVASGNKFPRAIGIDYTTGPEYTVALEHDGYDWYFEDLNYAAPPGRTIDLRSIARSDSSELLTRPPPKHPRTRYDLDEAMQLQLQPSDYEREPYVIRRHLGDEGGQVVVFAELDMFTNASLLVADNGAFLVNLFRSNDIEEVEFVNGYTGAGAEDPFESMRTAKLGALFLQILLFLAVLYAAVGLPFARLRDPERQRRRSFAEHVRTLGQRYAQAHAARYVASLYSAWALDRLRDRLRPGAARGLHPLAQAIAARTGRSEGQVMELLVRANDLRESSTDAKRGGAAELDIMRQLAKLLDETGGAR